MCWPLAIMIGAGIASAALNTVASMDVNNANASSANAWASDQRRLLNEENMRQNAMRQEAEKARMNTVNKMDVASQTDALGVETKRLEGDLNKVAGNEAAPITASNVADTEMGADLKFSGEGAKTARAASINNATQESKKRIAALAAVQAYGGSQEGLGRRNPRMMSESGQAINTQNYFRKGSEGIYRMEASTRPQTYRTSPWVGLVAGIGNAISGGVGSYMGQQAGAASGASFNSSMGSPMTWNDSFKTGAMW